MAAQARQIADLRDASDSKVEADLTRLGIQFELLSKVPPGAFDRTASLDNQVRMGKPLDKATTLRYEEAVKTGDRFPPIVAQRLDSGQYLVLDGNHRLEVHARHDRTLDVYVVTGTPAALVRFSFEANARHGLPASEDDRLHHALYMIDNGMAVKEAAQRFQIPQSRLQIQSLAVQAGRRADDIGVPRSIWQNIPKTLLSRLNSIRTDEGFAVALQLVADADMKHEAVGRLLADLAEVRGSAAKQVQIVSRWRTDLANQIGQPASGRRHGVMSPRTKLRMGISNIAGLIDPTVMDEIPPVERPALAQEVTATIEKLQRIRAHLTGGASGA